MKPEDNIRLLLVDDHPVVRNGLQRMHELEPRIQIVGEAATMQSAVDAARRLGPDVILMDVRLPDGDGIAACRKIKQFLPATHILFLTSDADNRFVLASMEAGADGYLLKESGGQRIVDAIHSILNGGTIFDPVITRGVMGNLRGGGVNPLDALTGQEGRVLAEVAKGKTNKEVAVAWASRPRPPATISTAFSRSSTCIPAPKRRCSTPGSAKKCPLGNNANRG